MLAGQPSFADLNRRHPCCLDVADDRLSRRPWISKLGVLGLISFCTVQATRIALVTNYSRPHLGFVYLVLFICLFCYIKSDVDRRMLRCRDAAEYPVSFVFYPMRPQFQSNSSIAVAAARFCSDCQSFQPPRTSHCKKCRVCVPLRDHHVSL